MKTQKPIIILVVLGLVTYASYWAYNNYFNVDSGLIQASGTIEAKNVELNARISGTLMNLNCNEGDPVQKDTLLADLSRNDLLAQRERDALGVVALEAKLDDLLSGARSEEIKEAAANVSIAAASLQQADFDLERAEKLSAAGALSEVELQKLQFNQDNLSKQLEAAQARLSLLQAGNRPGVIAAASAELERSRAVLKATDALLADLQIYSPIDGVITSKNYEQGEYVQMGAALAQITDLNDLWIKVYIPTNDLPWIKLGQNASVSVSGCDQVFSGTVVYIASQGEFTPKTIQTKKERTNVVYAVKVEVANADGLLKPGMPADVVFDGSENNAQ